MIANAALGALVPTPAVAQPLFSRCSTVAQPLQIQMCVLDPDGGVALGTVTADTRVECVCVHPCVLQTFSITDAFLEGVKSRATSFPEDLRLDNLISAGALWAGAKRQLTREVRCVHVHSELTSYEPMLLCETIAVHLFSFVSCARGSSCIVA
jgi:hypothetical protein